MAVFKAGRFNVSTTPGIQSIEVGFRPKAVIFFGNLTTLETIASRGIRSFVGWGVAPTQCAYVAYAIDDPSAPHASLGSGRAIKVDRCMGHCDGDGSILWEASFFSLDDYGFSIDVNLDLPPSEPYLIHYFAIGGTEVAAAAGYFNAVSSGGGQSVSVPIGESVFGNSVDLVFAMHCNSLLLGGEVPARFGFGVAGDGQSAVALLHQPGDPGIVQEDQELNNSAIVGLSGNPTTKLFEGQIFGGTNGFDIVWLTDPPQPYIIPYLAIGGVRNRVRKDTQDPVGTSVKTGFKFSPQAMLGFGAGGFAGMNNSRASFMLAAGSVPGPVFPTPGDEYTMWGAAIGPQAGIEGSTAPITVSSIVGRVLGIWADEDPPPFTGAALLESFNKDPWGVGHYWGGDSFPREFGGVYLGTWHRRVPPIPKPHIFKVPALSKMDRVVQAPDFLTTRREKFGVDSGLGSDAALAPRALISGTDVGKGTDVGNVPLATFTHLTDGNSAVDGTVFTTASFAPAANSLALVAVFSVGAGAPAPTLSGGGMTSWTQIGTQTLSWGRVTTFRALQASPGAPAALTITHGSTVKACIWSVDQVTGVPTSGTNGSGAVAQAPQAVGYGQNALLEFGPLSDPDNFVWAAIAHPIQELASACRGFYETANRNTDDTSAPGNLETGAHALVPDLSWGWTTVSEWIGMGVEVVINAGFFAPNAPTDFPLFALMLNLNDPTSPTKALINLADRIVSWKKSGPRRQFELDAIEAGTAEFKLRNHDRYLDPEYSSGPWYGHLWANREIYILALFNGQWYPLFYGFVEDYDAERTGFSGNYTTLKAVDATEILNSESIDSGPAVLITEFGENKDVRFTSKGANPEGLSRMERAGPFGGSDDPPELGAGAGGDLTIEYVPAWHSAYPTGARYFPEDQKIRVLLKITGSTAQEVIDAVNSDPACSQLVKADLPPWSTGTGTPPAMAPTPLGGGFIREYTGYRINQALSSLEEPWPLGDRITDYGVELLQAASIERKNNVAAWQHLTDVAVTTELGVLYVDQRGRVVFQQRSYRDSQTVSGIFTDLPHATEFPYSQIKPHYDNKRVYNEVIVSQNSTDQSVTVSDAVSKTRFRKRTKTLTVMAALIPSLSTIANYLLNKYKNQKVRYDTMTTSWQSGMPVAMLDFLFGQKISDLITIRRNPTAGPGVSSPQTSSNHFLEGYDVECTEERTLNFTIYLSPQ